MQISFIVPVYNVEKYIVKCLESIQKQTMTDFECLVIDDGSPDSSIALAKDFVRNDKRFRFYQKENGGLSDARNFGKDLAKGDYLCFVDSDDYIAPTLAEKTIASALKYNSDIVAFDLLYVYPNGHKSLSIGGDKEITTYKENKKLVTWNCSANNKIYRASFLRDKYFIKGMWYEDLAIVPIWLSLAKSVSYVACPLYYYVQHPSSISYQEDWRLFDIYKSLKNIQVNLSLDNDILANFIIENGLCLVILKIRNFKKKETRLLYYRHNIKEVSALLPTWYTYTKNYSLKWRIVFFLNKHHLFNLLDRIYQR